MSQAPVLLIVFNRPETTKITFDTLRNKKPSKLYIAADGPRNQQESILCEEVRRLTEEIDWECKVNRLYRDQNLGCKRSVVEAINWFFLNEEMGIILEDDCVADLSFFEFCNTMLHKHKNDINIKSISGSNFLFGALDDIDDYYFLNYTMMWGWATWRRAWNEIDWNTPFDKKLIEDKINQNYKNKNFRIWIKSLIYHFYDDFDRINDIWDVHVLTTYIMKNGLQILPSKNLIRNIGVEGTHSFNGSKSINTPTKSLAIEKLSEKEKKIEITSDIQELFMNNVINVYLPEDTFTSKLKRKISQLLK